VSARIDVDPRDPLGTAFIVCRHLRNAGALSAGTFAWSRSGRVGVECARVNIDSVTMGSWAPVLSRFRALSCHTSPRKVRRRSGASTEPCVHRCEFLGAGAPSSYSW
jgi:hypothetical protein